MRFVPGGPYTSSGAVRSRTHGINIKSGSPVV